MIKRTTIALLCGLIIVLVYAPYDPWVKQQAGHAFQKAFEGSMGCAMSFDVAQINFLQPKLVLKNVRVHAVDDQISAWQWQAKEYRTGFSWANLFVFGSIDMWVEVDELSMQSHLNNGQLAIAPHFAQFFVSPTFFIPIGVHAVLMNKAQFAVHDDALGIDCAMHWNSESRVVGDQFKTRLYLADGTVVIQGRTLFERSGGNVLIDIAQDADSVDIVFRMDARIWLPHLANEEWCFVSGTWRNSHGRFAIANAQDSMRIDPIIITQKNGIPWINIQARMPLSFCTRFGRNDPLSNTIGGVCLAHVQGGLSQKEKLSGYVVLDDMSYQDHLWRAALKTSFIKQGSMWHGNVHARIPSVTEFDGSWHWSQQEKNGVLLASNSNAIPIPKTPYWQIPPRKCEVRLDAQGGMCVTGRYSCCARNTVLDDTIHADGKLEYADNQLSLFGLFNEKPYTSTIDCNQFPYLKRFVYCTADDTSHVSIAHSPKKETGFSGTISVGLIRSIVAQLTNYDLQGEGVAHINLFLDAHNRIKTQIRLKDTTVRLPQTYNFINKLDARIDYDPAKKTVRLHALECAMHAGSCAVRDAVCVFDENWQLSFVHAPVFFNHCLLNMKKDLFATVSGHALLEKRFNQLPSVRGRFIVDRAQLKENILSHDLQNKIRSFTGNMFDVSERDVVCDLGIETRDVIRVDTPFLQTNVAVNLHVKDSVLNPSISGSISLLSGTLRFPYKPLYITKGFINFVPGHQTDPLIDLVARNKIKQHNVTLRVTGSLLNHHLVLESTPPLAQEQIISLLLVGSHDQTLNSIMPALIMQNLRHLIFDATQTSFFERYLMPFDQSLKINLIPSFTDQTGRGGLRGSLEIDVNDRWRAMIQKNFSLTEDTRVEIEYVFSDDITVRAIRDERRDLGAEVEMRWKF